MKTIKHGKHEYSRMEDLFDIGDERFITFKQYILQVFEQLDKPLFAACFSRYKELFNKGNHADGMIEWDNFRKSIELSELNHDALSICYALIHLKKGEKMSDTSEDAQLSKLKEMRENGLSRGEVEREVKNFMKASPETFGGYLEALEVWMKMTPNISQEY